MELIKNEQCGDYIFVIGDKEKDYYFGILKNNGKHEFHDFYTASVFLNLLEHKKMILLHGNCHITRIREMLNDSLKSQFFIYDIPLIYLNKGKEIESDILANADIFIHQDIQKENQYGYKLSDEFVLMHLNPQCKEIGLPNLFGIGRAFFPQSIMGNANNRIYKAGIGLFPYKDIVAEKMCEYESKDITVTKITQTAEELFDEKYIADNFDKYMNSLYERESCCHVKMSDYIKMNYQQKRLFWDAGHPTGEVIKEICRQIINILQINVELEDMPKHLEMDTYQTPVYENVKSVLGLNWQDETMRVYSDNKLAEKMDVEEYVKEYLYWCIR